MVLGTAEKSKMIQIVKKYFLIFLVLAGLFYSIVLIDEWLLPFFNGTEYLLQFVYVIKTAYIILSICGFIILMLYLFKLYAQTIKH